MWTPRRLRSVTGVDEEVTMPKLTNLCATLALLVAVLAAGGCQAKDRAGGSADAEVTELRVAFAGDPGPGAHAWADEIDQLSKGTLKITPVVDVRAGQADYEAGTIADVRAGTFDLAWVGARAFDGAGVTGFQPLLAPLLIDSLELEGKVFAAGIPKGMLSGVEELDLVGVGVLPGPIRRVLGVEKPFTAPTDFKGQVVGIQASGVASQTFRALGGTARPVAAGVDLDGLDAYDQQLSSIHGNHYDSQAKYVTGNLGLWPRPVVIVANQAAYQRLTDDQHAILAAAAKDAVPAALDGERTGDTDSIAALCKAGLTFAQSTDAELAAFRKAVAPVYATIGTDMANVAALDQITTIKNALHRAPDSAECANVPTDQPIASRYDGTYQMRIVWPKVKTTDARCMTGGPGKEGGPDINIYDMVLDRGTMRIWLRVGGPDAKREMAWEAPYEFFKDQVVFGSSGSGYVMDFTYKDGTLTLSNLRNGECGDRAIFTTRPWIRQ